MVSFGKKRKSVKKTMSKKLGYAVKRMKNGNRIVKVSAKVSASGKKVYVYLSSKKKIPKGKKVYATKYLANLALKKSVRKVAKKPVRKVAKRTVRKSRKVVKRSRFGLSNMIDGSVIVKVDKGRSGFVVCSDLKNEKRFKVYSVNTFKVKGRKVLGIRTKDSRGRINLYEVPVKAKFFSVRSGSSKSAGSKKLKEAKSVAKMYNKLGNDGVDLSLIKCHTSTPKVRKVKVIKPVRLTRTQIANRVINDIFKKEYAKTPNSQVKNRNKLRKASKRINKKKGNGKVPRVSLNEIRLFKEKYPMRITKEDESVMRRVLQRSNSAFGFNGSANKVNYGFSKYL
jgi:hypothetical protein